VVEERLGDEARRRSVASRARCPPAAVPDEEALRNVDERLYEVEKLEDDY
jgi:hypothetical protein